MPKDEPFKGVLAQRHLGTRQPAEVSEVVTYLLDELHLLV